MFRRYVIPMMLLLLVLALAACAVTSAEPAAGAVNPPVVVTAVVTPTAESTNDPTSQPAIEPTSQPTNQPADQPTAIPVLETAVKYVMALENVNVRSGPGTGYGKVGWVAGGQIALVTGASAEGDWWRVICPDDTIGNCWVSADPALTQPTTSPGTGQPDNQPTAIPMLETAVRYVMAQADVKMRSGPGASYGEIGWVAGGQTALVTGASADGQWWRVICPDDTVGNCWVSADPTLTQPANWPDF